MIRKSLTHPLLWFLLCVSVFRVDAWADSPTLRLPKIFSDHMVLQREGAIPVYGWASPGAEVRVTLAGKTSTAKTNDKGRWMAHLPKQSAGGPYELTITDGKETITYKDVMVGEVWLCSGQSNMTLPLFETDKGKEVAAASKNENLRYFTIGYNMGHIANQPLDDLQGDKGYTYSWECVTPKMAGGMSAVAYYFGEALQKELNIPVGMIHASWGGVGIQAYTPREGCAADPPFAEAMKDWDRQWAEFRETNDPEKDPNRHANFNAAIQQPAGLYNGSIAPVAPYGLRGFAWYQGEADAGNAAPYTERLTRMIRLWRKAWGWKETPFLIVQLPGFGTPNEGTDDDGWAQVREAQKQAAKATHSHLVVIIDSGEAENIHPMNKKVVGDRLAKTALAKVYGRKKIRYSSPVFQSVRRKGSDLVVTFKNTYGGLRTSDGGPLKGFVLSGADGAYHKASAKIEGHNRVVVSSPDVPQPVRVRYAWAKNPVCNLCNKENLPAGPFQAEIGSR
ncbi:MAG: hypothetical protein JXA11_05330 [Phycisphaerae bacterium]|nr:hypothetical protein [Phycisphaerae bacterium]